MIRYRLNENTGHLMPSLPNFVTLLQVVGAGLLFCGFIIKWLVFKGTEVGILGSEAQLGLNLIVIGIAVLLLTNLVLLVRFVLDRKSVV